MKTKHYCKFIFLMAGIFLSSACQKDDKLEPNGVKIAFQAVTGLKSSADTLLMEEAFIGIGSIDLKRDGETDSLTVEKIVYDGPYVIDLLNSNVSPAIRWIFAEPGYYSEIDVTTYNSLPQGKTIILKGTLFPVDGQKGIPFEFFTSRNYTFNIQNNDGITIREGEGADLLVVFNLSDLFRETDLNKLKKNEQGVVVISEDEGASIIAPIINTFEAFSTFVINDGLPFPGNHEVNPDNEIPDEIENPEEVNDDGDDKQDDPSSGDEEEDEGSAGGDGNNDDGNNNDGNAGNEEGGSSEDDDEDDSERDDEKNPASGSNEDEEDEESGNDEDEQDLGNNEQDDDDGDDDAREDDDTEDNDKQEDSGKGKDNNPGKGKGKNKDKDKGKGNKG